MAEKVFALHSYGSCEEASRELCAFLVSSGLTISAAESATCGLVAKYLTDMPGSSAWYWGGVESYANEAKVRLLGVPSSILNNPVLGPVSSECAIAMADGMRALSGTSLALSVTGIAGPSGAEPGKDVGTVYLGFSSSFRESTSIRLSFSGLSRTQAREAFCWAVLKLALSYAQGHSIVDIVSSWY